MLPTGWFRPQHFLCPPLSEDPTSDLLWTQWDNGTGGWIDIKGETSLGEPGVVLEEDNKDGTRKTQYPLLYLSFKWKRCRSTNWQSLSFLFPIGLLLGSEECSETEQWTPATTVMVLLRSKVITKRGTDNGAVPADLKSTGSGKRLNSELLLSWDWSWKLLRPQSQNCKAKSDGSNKSDPQDQALLTVAIFSLAFGIDSIVQWVMQELNIFTSYCKQDW